MSEGLGKPCQRDLESSVRQLPLLCPRTELMRHRSQLQPQSGLSQQCLLSTQIASNRQNESSGPGALRPTCVHHWYRGDHECSHIFSQSQPPTIGSCQSLMSPHPWGFVGDINKSSCEVLALQHEKTQTQAGQDLKMN